MITLLTGQPGHGKTLRAIHLAMKEREAGRAVYACRVRGLDAEKTGFLEIPSMSEWESLPDGSVVFVDECYEDIPSRAPGAKMPDWEKNLATHRHRGFDFIIVCQLGNQISSHVRALVDKHVHVRRKFGFQKALLIEWDRYQASVASNASIAEARRSGWSYPKKLFGLYKSAEVHTVKRSIPWQFIALPVLVGIVAFAIYSVRSGLKAMGQTAAVSSVADSGSHNSVMSQGAPVGTSRIPPLTPTEFIELHASRFASIPWSAPWHDQRQPEAKPEILCVMSEAKGCRCYTEQVTRISGVPELQCIQIARDGIYNPYRAPIGQGQGVGQGQDRFSQHPSAPVRPAVAYESIPLPVNAPPNWLRSSIMPTQKQ